MADRDARPARLVAVRAAARLWALNLLAAFCIGLAYLEHAPSTGSVLAWVFAHLALLATLGVLSTPCGGLAVALALTLGPTRTARLAHIVQAAAWTGFLLFLYVDTRVWAIFRYHLNGMVWNLLTTPGGEDAFQLGPRELALPLAAGAAWFALELALLTRWSRSQQSVRAPESALARAAAWGLPGLVLAALVAEKAIYARADLRRDARITVFARVLPFYLPLTVKKLAERHFGYEPEQAERVEVHAEGLLMRYPLEAPSFPPDGPRPNVLIVVIDSLRADALNDQAMPELMRWAAGARRFEDHASGGNATRFGIFTLLYGLDGAYWDPVYREHCPPVLVTALTALGYDLRVLSAASMSYPEFRSTAWVTMEDRVEDDFPGKQAWLRDAAVARRFASWMEARAAEPAPPRFFAFTLLDSPHQRYSFDPELAPFQPSEEELDYLSIAGTPDAPVRERIHNRYLNAVHFADRQLGLMLTALERTGELARTLVIVTGDHGEEFWEHGYFGHTSNFTPAQVHVGFVMGGPGVPPGTEQRPTSHVDVVPTILELCGADPALRSGYTSGESLLAPPASRTRTIAGWQEIALWVDGGILWVPLQGHKGFAEAFAYDWTPLPESTAFLRTHALELVALAQRCRNFLH